jgi:hypothetical protein
MSTQGTSASRACASSASRTSRRSRRSASEIGAMAPIVENQDVDLGDLGEEALVGTVGACERELAAINHRSGHRRAVRDLGQQLAARPPWQRSDSTPAYCLRSDPLGARASGPVRERGRP